ncbi:hypothetical protein DH2020_003685 [Rehmannia glutinosa]|uniref:RRM domain-containing protein n=1 Tax=Rehmannia glutinosa TaxID=99300 RepID=A0ABR0XMA3_REHGL
MNNSEKIVGEPASLAYPNMGRLKRRIALVDNICEHESVLIQYGRVKEIKFFEEWASVINGHIFNGRACVVAFSTPQTIKRMGISYMNKTQPQAQSQLQGRNPTNDGSGRGHDGSGFDLAFMGRGGGYGGFLGPAFPGMLPPFPGVNSMGLPGVAPHVNGMGMMGNAGMVGPHSGTWNDANMGGSGGEEHGRESSYAGEDNASKYGYGEASHDKGVRSSAASHEKKRNSERDWSSNPEKRHCEEREHDGERYDREARYRKEKDMYRDYHHKDCDSGYDDDWDIGQSSRSRSRSCAVPKGDHMSRSRDVDYGKRRCMPSE